MSCLQRGSGPKMSAAGAQSTGPSPTKRLAPPGTSPTHKRPKEAPAAPFCAPKDLLDVSDTLWVQTKSKKAGSRKTPALRWTISFRLPGSTERHTVKTWGKAGWALEAGDKPGGAWRPGGHEALIGFIAKAFADEANAAAQAAAAQRDVQGAASSGALRKREDALEALLCLRRNPGPPRQSLG